MEAAVRLVTWIAAPNRPGPRLMVSTGHDARTEIRDMTNKTLCQALASAWIFLVSLALAACGSVAPARSASPGFTGYDWHVLAIGDGGKVTRIPARLEVALQFSARGQFGANDSINFHSGTYQTTRDGFTTGVLAQTLVAYAGHDRAILLAMRAMQSFDAGVRATARLTGHRLVVDVGSYELTCQRAGPQADAPAPVPTG
jgi:heat shock protein HslJ